VTRDTGGRGRRLGTYGAEDADIELDETFVNCDVEGGIEWKRWIERGWRGDMVWELQRG